MKYIKIILLTLLLTTTIYADTLKNIIDENYKNNHFTKYENYSMQKQNHNMPVLLHKDGKKESKLYFEQFQENKDSEKHLFVYHSGKNRGLKVLLDLEKRDVDVNIWVPQLRKTKRLNVFDTSKSWNGSNFTYGEILLKKPENCIYELMKSTSCFVQSRNLGSFDVDNYCEAEQKSIIKVKSTPRNFLAEYDYRVLYMDKKTHHDYRIEYYKNEKVIKTIEKGWYRPNKEVALVGYWYAKDYIKNTESLIYIPKESHIYNAKLSKKFFSKTSLHKLKKI